MQHFPQEVLLIHGTWQYKYMLITVLSKMLIPLIIISTVSVAKIATDEKRWKHASESERPKHLLGFE